VHVLLTEERDGYYADFGSMAQMADAFSKGFVYSGQYSKYRERRHGNSAKSVPAERLIVFAQNHDQVGNRMRGDRLSSVVPFDALKLAAGLVMASPFVPLIFMGEEYAETAPFQYFVSHGDRDLIEAVRKGRREEFSRFQWQGELPDPQSEDTFQHARLNWELRSKAPHSLLLTLYKELLRLRREHPVWSKRDKDRLEASACEAPKILFVRRWTDSAEALAIFNFERGPAACGATIPAGRWKRILDSADPHWGGKGGAIPEKLKLESLMPIMLPACSFALFDKEEEAG
jgi:maltooligosyltrehalose trehalohydrolase